VLLVDDERLAESGDGLTWRVSPRDRIDSIGVCALEVLTWLLIQAWVVGTNSCSLDGIPRSGVVSSKRGTLGTAVRQSTASAPPRPARTGGGDEASMRRRVT